jgi:DNA-binding IclR family transcriptional regulator
MKATEIRDMQWQQIREHLSGPRLVVLASLRAQPEPVTSRQLAAVCGLDLLSTRPRLTELVELGLVECVGKQGHEGLYVAVDEETARQRHEALRARQPEQLQLAKV